MKKETKMEEVLTDPIIDVDNKDYKDLYLRLYADMENLKKRLTKEKVEAVEKNKVQMIESILDINSDLGIALKNYSDVPEGIKIIVSKVDTFLKSQGIREAQTNTYDLDLHEVISIIESGKSGMIIDVVSKGYFLGEKIIRYPKVILSK